MTLPKRWLVVMVETHTGEVLKAQRITYAGWTGTVRLPRSDLVGLE